MSWSFRGASWLLPRKRFRDNLWSAEHRWPPIMFCHVFENVEDTFSGRNVPVPYRSARVALENSMDLWVSLTFRFRTCSRVRWWQFAHICEVRYSSNIIRVTMGRAGRLARGGGSLAICRKCVRRRFVGAGTFFLPAPQEPFPKAK